jgi:type IV pilus assembly protein PilE
MFCISASPFCASGGYLRHVTHRFSTGFSLIELLVVLVITGIVSAIALPSYTQHVQRGHRAEAMAALLEAQHFMERHYSAQGRYDGSAESPGTNPDLPLRLQSIPVGSDPLYRLQLEAATVNSYDLTAQPVGSMANDKCGTLTIEQTGLKGLSGSDLNVVDCWR